MALPDERSIQLAMLIVPLCAMGLVAGCGSDAEALGVDNKQGCIVEVSRRLLAWQEDRECETGVARYAGYCYNTAPGDQFDICRGGDVYCNFNYN